MLYNDGPLSFFLFAIEQKFEEVLCKISEKLKTLSLRGHAFPLSKKSEKN